MLDRIVRPRNRTAAAAAAAAVLIATLCLGVAWPQETRKTPREERPQGVAKTHELWFFFSATGPDLSKAKVFSIRFVSTGGITPSEL